MELSKRLRLAADRSRDPDLAILLREAADEIQPEEATELDVDYVEPEICEKITDEVDADYTVSGTDRVEEL